MGSFFADEIPYIRLFHTSDLICCNLSSIVLILRIFLHTHSIDMLCPCLSLEKTKLFTFHLINAVTRFLAVCSMKFFTLLTVSINTADYTLDIAHFQSVELRTRVLFMHDVCKDILSTKMRGLQLTLNHVDRFTNQQESLLESKNHTKILYS